MKSLLCILLMPLAALAQNAPDDYTLIGAGVRSRPEYDGSNSRTVDLIPVLRYYGKPWFARTTQGMLEAGARAELEPGFDAGIQLAYEQGPRDRDPGASIGAHLEHDRKFGPVPVNFLVRLRRHLESERGTQADFRATVGVYGNGRAAAGVFTQATWASSRFTQAYYGISEGGLLYTSLGALGSYNLSKQWVLVGSAEGRRLSDDVARSPIVERRTGYYASAGLAYRF
jgi:outer membrane protein